MHKDDMSLFTETVFDYEESLPPQLGQRLPQLPEGYFWRVREARELGYLRVELRVKAWYGSRRLSYDLADVLTKDARLIRHAVVGAACAALVRPDATEPVREALELLGDYGDCRWAA